jgi:hypothetical protein
MNFNVAIERSIHTLKNKPVSLAVQMSILEHESSDASSIHCNSFIALDMVYHVMMILRVVESFIRYLAYLQVIDKHSST